MKEKFEAVLRLKAIEIFANWEGRIASTQLMQHFGISRQQASADINRYLRVYNLDSLEYSQARKGYIPIKKFKPVFTSGHINEYMDLMSGIIHQSAPIALVDTPFASTIQLPDRAVKPKIVRGLIKACRQGIALNLEYSSMKNPKPHNRIFTPHTLIYSGFRWHVRGFCHVRQEFRDFLISRIYKLVENPNVDGLTNENDDAWHDETVIKLIANPRLSKDQQVMIEKDYAMRSGQITIKTKKALVHYTLQKYQVALTEGECESPYRYPLILSNYKDVSEFMFNR